MFNRNRVLLGLLLAFAFELTGCVSAEERRLETEAQNRAIQQQYQRQRQTEADRHEQQRWDSLTPEQQHEETLMKQKIQFQQMKTIGEVFCAFSGGCY